MIVGFAMMAGADGEQRYVVNAHDGDKPLDINLKLVAMMSRGCKPQCLATAT